MWEEGPRTLLTVIVYSPLSSLWFWLVGQYYHTNWSENDRETLCVGFSGLFVCLLSREVEYFSLGLSCPRSDVVTLSRIMVWRPPVAPCHYCRPVIIWLILKIVLSFVFKRIVPTFALGLLALLNWDKYYTASSQGRLYGSFYRRQRQRQRKDLYHQSVKL